MSKKLAWLLVLACACSSESVVTNAGEHPSRLRVRLAIADANAASLVVYDVADEDLAAPVALAAPADALVASYTGQSALVRSGRTVHVLSSGVSVIPHKDHIHIFKSKADLLGPALAVGEGFAAVFGGGAWGMTSVGPDANAFGAARVDEEAWIRGARELSAVALASPPTAAAFVVPFLEAPHVAAGGRILDFAAPDRPSDLGGCTAPRAAVSNGVRAVFVCDEGFVLSGPGAPAEPVALAEGIRPSRLASLHRQPLVIGRGDGDVRVVVDTESRAARIVRLGLTTCDEVLEIGSGAFLTVLTTDGRVVRIDLASGAPTGEVGGLPACDPASAVHARIAATPGRAWITEPVGGNVVEVDTGAWRIRRRIAVGGSPHLITALGLDARNVDLAQGNDRLSDP